MAYTHQHHQARASKSYDHLKLQFEELATLDECNPRYHKLREHLVTEHLPVAQHIARRFSNRGESHEDLIQVAAVGLINAVDRYEPDRGVDFLSYAVPTIMGEVRRYFRDNSWSVRMPRRLKELHLVLKSATNTLAQQLGRTPTPREIATSLNLDEKDVAEGLRASNAYHSASLDALLAENENTSSTLGGILGEVDQQLKVAEDRESLQPALAQLPKRERTIILMRYFGSLTQKQIAKKMGISQMHVSRLLAKTLISLRQDLTLNPAE